jgi:hypothetical protein
MATDEKSTATQDGAKDSAATREAPTKLTKADEKEIQARDEARGYSESVRYGQPYYSSLDGQYGGADESYVQEYVKSQRAREDRRNAVSPQ